MKSGFAALSALVAVLALSSAASACEQHMQHQTTAQAAITTLPQPAVPPRAVAEDELVLPQSKPELATGSTEALGVGMGCAKRAKQETVYLTQ